MGQQGDSPKYGERGFKPDKIDFGNLINEKVWEEISKELGEITDVKLTHLEGYSRITYKSNGKDERIEISGNGIKQMIVAFAYSFEAFNYNTKSYSAFY